MTPEKREREILAITDKIIAEKETTSSSISAPRSVPR